MIFSELYGCYYNTVAKILQKATEKPVTKQEFQAIINEHAFSESVLTIEPSLAEGRWQLLYPDGTTPVLYPPSMPLTLLQKRWLKAISFDPRMRLFDFDVAGLEEITPLFVPQDITVFDQYADGDPYGDETYIRTFRMILSAIKNRNALSLEVMNRKGGKTKLSIMPEYLEYSEKDDKFRLITSGSRYGKVINLARIVSCSLFFGEYQRTSQKCIETGDKSVVIELYNERNALERILLHFAHFEKQAMRIDDKHYRITVNFHQDDESEMVIRILSFGPFAKVTEPQSFVELIKKRLEMQKSCELF